MVLKEFSLFHSLRRIMLSIISKPAKLQSHLRRCLSQNAEAGVFQVRKEACKHVLPRNLSPKMITKGNIFPGVRQTNFSSDNASIIIPRKPHTSALHFNFLPLRLKCSGESSGSNDPLEPRRDEIMMLNGNSIHLELLSEKSQVNHFPPSINRERPSLMECMEKILDRKGAHIVQLFFYFRIRDNLF